MVRLVALLLVLLLATPAALLEDEPSLSDERLVLQTSLGDVELAFFPEVAPVTVAHIIELGRLGAYTTDHFFRVDKGFVAQVADVVGGRNAPLSELQRREGVKTVPGEFSDVKHTRGILSMGRYDDPDSATSSFSILLGAAPHLDGKYAVFGRLVSGDAVLRAMEEVETKREGIFVMPKERIQILSSYVYSAGAEGGGTSGSNSRVQRCSASLAHCKAQVKGLQVDLHKCRAEKLP